LSFLGANIAPYAAFSGACFRPLPGVCALPMRNGNKGQSWLVHSATSRNWKPIHSMHWCLIALIGVKFTVTVLPPSLRIVCLIMAGSFALTRRQAVGSDDRVSGRPLLKLGELVVGASAYVIILRALLLASQVRKCASIQAEHLRCYSGGDKDFRNYGGGFLLLLGFELFLFFDHGAISIIVILNYEDKDKMILNIGRVSGKVILPSRENF